MNGPSIAPIPITHRSASTLRRVFMGDVRVMINISHGHHDPTKRVEQSQIRHEPLMFSITAWHDGPSDVAELRQVFNYCPLHTFIQGMANRIVTRPLESLMDEVMNRMLLECEEQELPPVAVRVTLKRPSLIEGVIELESHRVFDPPVLALHDVTLP